VTEDLKAMADALVGLDDGWRSKDEADLIRFVASAFHGVAKGLEDAGDKPAGGAVRFAGAEAVRLLKSGEWREVAGLAPVGSGRLPIARAAGSVS
jgi:hypothetical protein